MSNNSTHSNNDLIVKSNTLNEASFNLTTMEYKLILYIASKIKKDDKDFNVVKIPVSEFINAIGVRGNAYYNEIDKLTSEILTKTIEIYNGKDFKKLTWFSLIKYNDGEGSLTVKFNEELKPFLLQLQGNFFKYAFGQIAYLKSTYSIRIFELLKQYVPIGERTITVEQLKYILKVENSYKRYSNFKQRILLKSIKEIHEKTDLSFDFEEIKTGRKVTKIRFKNISFMSKHLKSIEKMLEEKDPMKEKLNKIFNPIGIFFTDEDFQKLKEYDEKIIANAVIQLKNRLEKNDDILYPIPYLFGILNKMKQTCDEEETQKEQFNSEDIGEFEKQLLIEEIVNRFNNNIDVVPRFLAEEEAFKIFKQHNIPKDQYSKIWKEIEEETIKKIRARKKQYI